MVVLHVLQVIGMDKDRIKLVVFDLDGTLTQHKTKLSPGNRKVLDALCKKYKLLMAGAGMCRRIFEQMERYPIDILGSYGMQYAEYDSIKKDIEIVRNVQVPCDRERVEENATALRKKYGYTDFFGDNVEYHSSGCVTIPLLGTKARQEDKLAFDPDGSKRRKIYDEVKALFQDYAVFVSGSSSFDMVPAPYNKAYALSMYCAEHDITHDQVVYVGDGYGSGENDEPVYLADFNFITINNYLDFPKRMEQLL